MNTTSTHAYPTATRSVDSENAQINQVQSLADAAYLCECQGRLDEAEQLYQQALTLSIRMFGDTHLAVATHLSNLAKFYHCQQRYTEAKPLLEKALKIQQPTDSPITGHLDTGDMLYQLADIHCHLENYGKAENLFQQALSKFRQTLGPDHERTRAIHDELIKMLTMVIDSGKFETLTAEIPPLDLDKLSETYSWAKPEWMNHSEPADNYSWIKLQISADDEKA